MRAILIWCLIIVSMVVCCGHTLATTVGEGRIVWVSSAGGWRLNLWSINPDGTERTQLTKIFAQALFPSISPDATRVAFASADTGVWYIYLINMDGTNLEQFTDFSSAVPDWSPDGKSLIFNSDHDDEPKDIPDLWGMNLDGTHLVEYVDSPPTIDFNGQWSPDGKKILFVSNRDGDDNLNLYVMNTDGSDLKRLTSHQAADFNPRWSPNGEKIAFVSDRGGNLDIYTMDSDGSNVEQLTDYSGYDDSPAWSPSGDRIVFVSERDVHRDLWIVNVDGSNPTQLTDDDAADIHPDWR